MTESEQPHVFTLHVNLDMLRARPVETLARFLEEAAPILVQHQVTYLRFVEDFDVINGYPRFVVQLEVVPRHDQETTT